MATEAQKAAARRNLEKARAARTASGAGTSTGPSQGLSTKKKNELPDTDFAFVKERKEPLVDASHVRNAIARFDQVKGVSDAERDRAWKRILAAARRFDVEVSESSWRELFKGGRANNDA